MSEPSSPHRHALLALTPVEHPPTTALTASTSQTWQPILQVSNQVVLYNPTSHALSIRANANQHQIQPPPERSKRGLPLREAESCPYCHRPFSDLDSEFEMSMGGRGGDEHGMDRRHQNYFKLLEVAHEVASRPSTPPPILRAESPTPEVGGYTSAANGAFSPGVMAQGYFKAFFKEERKIGMGANGSVYLCQHVLDGNLLGHFAVKKIAIGESHSYLLKILQEVRLLETLKHPNIITYHHAWLESSQFSSFGPPIPTLHVLMQWAEAGSLDDFIDGRLGIASPSTTFDSPVDSTDQVASLNAADGSELAKAARIRAFRAARKRSPHEERERRKAERARAVHLMSAEEVRGLFGDVVEGLAFLHDRSILHLDLKPGNVLLTNDSGKLIPRAMLSDFGTSRDMVISSRAQRSGNTGTLEYTSPESLPDPLSGILRDVDSKADMWSLGMILHRMLFFRLPYAHASGGEKPDSLEARREATGLDVLEGEVRAYAGFRKSRDLVTTFASRRLPQTYLILLENLLNITSLKRPSCDRVLNALREGKLDPVSPTLGLTEEETILPVALHRGPRTEPPSQAAIIEEDSSTAPPSPQSAPQMLHPVNHDEGDENYSHTNEYPTREGKDAIFHLDGGRREDAPRLALPAPPGYRGLVWPFLVASFPALGELETVLGPRRMFLLRTMKSCVLIVKVMTLASLCDTAAAERPTILVTVLLLIPALYDTLSESALVSILLAILHWLLLALLRSSGQCCIRTGTFPTSTQDFF